VSPFPAETPAVGKLAPGAGNLGIRSQPVRLPGRGEVLLEVLAAGICGTDLHIAADEFPSEPPVTMGHEVTGEVAAVGEGVPATWIGVRVACETYFAYCGMCEHCRAGRPNLCERRRSIGSKVDGGFARWLTLPARNLWRLPDHVGRHAGALAEPLACVARCLFDPSVVNAGDRVLVVGPGTMGVLTAQAARAAGGRVTLAGLARDHDRLALAASLGLATATIDDGIIDEPPFDVVAEASGHEAGAQTALHAVRKGGRYVQVGIFGQSVTIPLDLVLYKEVILTSGNASTPDSWRRAIHLLEARLVELDPLLTAVMPLSEWEQAFSATRRGEGMKIVLDPRQPAPAT
jgi:L-iditol 2-dehydrogenase